MEDQSSRAVPPTTIVPGGTGVTSTAEHVRHTATRHSRECQSRMMEVERSVSNAESEKSAEVQCAMEVVDERDSLERAAIAHTPSSPVMQRGGGGMKCDVGTQTLATVNASTQTRDGDSSVDNIIQPLSMAGEGRKENESGVVCGVGRKTRSVASQTQTSPLLSSGVVADSFKSRIALMQQTCDVRSGTTTSHDERSKKDRDEDILAMDMVNGGDDDRQGGTPQTGKNWERVYETFPSSREKENRSVLMNRDTIMDHFIQERGKYPKTKPPSPPTVQFHEGCVHVMSDELQAAVLLNTETRGNTVSSHHELNPQPKEE